MTKWYVVGAKPWLWACLALWGSTQSIQASIKSGASIADVAVPFPNGCGNPFSDIPNFVQFFEASLAQIAAKRGAESKGVVDLFAVAALRSELDRSFPNPSRESPLDRMIYSQLCNFSKVVLLQGPEALNAVTSADDRLAEHLVKVSSRLLQDAKKVYRDAAAERAVAKQKQAAFEARAGEVRKAQELGRQRIQDILVE